MIVLFDSSVWIDELRRGGLIALLPLVRRRFSLMIDATSAAEVVAGFSRPRDRKAFLRLLEPFEKAGRLVPPSPRDQLRAGEALSRLRERGTALRNPGAALSDVLQAATASRLGALLVTLNSADFAKLRTCIPFRFQGFGDFRRDLWGGGSPPG